MPITITRDDSGRRFTATGEGALTASDILTFMTSQRTGAYSRYALLFNNQAATLMVTADDMRTFASGAAALRETHGPRGPVAIVADRPGISALARLYESIARAPDSPALRIFDTPAEADAWLSTFG